MKGSRDKIRIYASRGGTLSVDPLDVFHSEEFKRDCEQARLIERGIMSSDPNLRIGVPSGRRVIVTMKDGTQKIFEGCLFRCEPSGMLIVYKGGSVQGQAEYVAAASKWEEAIYE